MLIPDYAFTSGSGDLSILLSESITLWYMDTTFVVSKSNIPRSDRLDSYSQTRGYNVTKQQYTPDVEWQSGLL